VPRGLSRPVAALALALVTAALGCSLLVSLDGLSGLPASEAGAGGDTALDARDASAMDATAGQDAEEDAQDGADDASAQDTGGGNSSVICGPSLSCSLSTPGNGCCVTFSDSGVAPENYGYSCSDRANCTEAGGGGGIIACDHGAECPNHSDICCWPGAPVPRTTFCFAADASNCSTELCDPDAAMPCVNHPTYSCQPTGPASPLPLAPLGYFICVRDGG
jgi:hypothetical protein